MGTCSCKYPERMRETPDDAARCAYCGGIIRLCSRDDDPTQHDRPAWVRRALSRSLPARVEYVR
jgi:hypothetical protein